MNASVPLGVPDRFSTPIPGETDKEDRPGEGEIVIQDSPERFVNFVRFFFSLFVHLACLLFRDDTGGLEIYTGHLQAGGCTPPKFLV